MSGGNSFYFFAKVTVSLKMSAMHWARNWSHRVQPGHSNGSLVLMLDGLHYNCPTNQTFVLQICAKMFETDRQRKSERARERERAVWSDRTSGRVSRNGGPVCWESSLNVAFCTWHLTHSCWFPEGLVHTDISLPFLTMFSHLPHFQMYLELGKHELFHLLHKKKDFDRFSSTNDEKSKRWNWSEARFIMRRPNNDALQLSLLLLAGQPLFVLKHEDKRETSEGPNKPILNFSRNTMGGRWGGRSGCGMQEYGDTMRVKIRVGGC